MKKIYRIIFSVAALSCAAGVNGQNLSDGGAYFQNIVAEKEGNRIVIETTADLSHLDLRSQQMALITPVLLSSDGAHKYSFAPVLVEGRARRKANRRAEVLDDLRFDPTPMKTVKYTRGSDKSLPLTLEAPYEGWMRNARLVFDEHITGCVSRGAEDRSYLASARVLPPLPVPDFNVIYATPPIEEVKLRTESYHAYLNFHVNRYDIIRSYMNNARELDEVDRILSKIGSDPYLTISGIVVTGYASPKGSAQSNMKLSENRAQAFVNYINQHHRLEAGKMQAKGAGDDWNGLVELMRSSSFGSRDKVIDIVGSQSNIDTRKNQLKALGADYRTLLNDYYPQLRRNEYKVDYIARSFSIAEMKEVIKTNPLYLSAYEMYQLAASYPKGSREYNEVFAVAARTYPNDTSVRMNIAALEIENGRLDDAVKTLQGIEAPEAWNNLGYIYAQKKEYDMAAEYFRRAANAGNAEARVNLDRLTEWQNEL